MKVGITFSAFDLFHAGHIKMLEEAKSKCDYLIVGLQLDPSTDRPKKNKPTQSIVERYVQVRSCKYIDEVVPYVTEQDLIDILNSFKIDLRIIGEEYKEKKFTGKEYCELRWSTSQSKIYHGRKCGRYFERGYSESCSIFSG